MPSAPTASPPRPASAFGRGWRVRPQAGTPVHAQIADRLGERISAGRLPVGTRLPAERELAETLGVSRMTVRQALAAVEQRGLLDRGVGRGTFVARPKVAHDRSRVAGFTEQLERAGLRARARVVAAAVEPAGEEVAEALGIEPGAPVTHVRRVRSDGRTPLTLEDFWVPEALAPALAGAELTGSLYTLLATRYSCGPVAATESLEPVLARDHEADLLGVPAGSPLMRVERVARDEDGIPVEYACDLHRGDRARFVIVEAADKTRSEVLKRYVVRKDGQNTIPASYSPTMANTGLAVTNFLDGQMTLPGAWVSPNLDAYRAALKTQGVSVYEGFDPLGSYRVERDLTSVYAMANLRGEVLTEIDRDIDIADGEFVVP